MQAYWGLPLPAAPLLLLCWQSWDSDIAKFSTWTVSSMCKNCEIILAVVPNWAAFIWQFHTFLWSFMCVWFRRKGTTKTMIWNETKDGLLWTFQVADQRPGTCSSILRWCSIQALRDCEVCVGTIKDQYICVLLFAELGTWKVVVRTISEGIEQYCYTHFGIWGILDVRSMPPLFWPLIKLSPSAAQQKKAFLW